MASVPKRWPLLLGAVFIFNGTLWCHRGLAAKAASRIRRSEGDADQPCSAGCSSMPGIRVAMEASA
jgi:hypothetical protein